MTILRRESKRETNLNLRTNSISAFNSRLAGGSVYMKALQPFQGQLVLGSWER